MSAAEEFDWIHQMAQTALTPRPCRVCGVVGVHAMAVDGSSQCDTCSKEELERTLEDRIRKQLIELLNGWPPRHREAALKPQTALEWVTRKDVIKLAKASIHAMNVVLVGGAGTGKTTLASIMTGSRYRALLREGEVPRPPVFMHAALIGSCRMKHDAETESTATKAKFVLIDDIGNETITPSSAMRDVILIRHAENKPTWFTTPFNAEEIAQRYGDGIARRMFENAVVFDMGSK